MCRACPRLVEWREQVAHDKRAAYRDWEYWGRPVPGFGDRGARILVLGLAPAAHGGNRTGRVFTGDRSGDWLYRAMHRAGLANQPTSESVDDGLELAGAWVTAAVKCAPPDNRPTPAERDTCRPYLERELALLPELRSRAGRATAPPLRARRRGAGCRATTAVRPDLLVPPEPAEHLHRPAHRADARPGPGAGCTTGRRRFYALTMVNTASSPERTRILVVGGGYVGMYTALRLQKRLSVSRQTA